MHLDRGKPLHSRGIMLRGLMRMSHCICMRACAGELSSSASGERTRNQEGVACGAGRGEERWGRGGRGATERLWWRCFPDCAQRVLHLKATSGRRQACAYTINCRRRKPNGILGENISAAAVVVLSWTFSTQCPAESRLSDLIGLICAPAGHPPLSLSPRTLQQRQTASDLSELVPVQTWVHGPHDRMLQATKYSYAMSR